MRVVVEAELETDSASSQLQQKKKKTNVVRSHQINTTQLKLPNTGQLGGVCWCETLPGCLICTQTKGKCDK